MVLTSIPLIEVIKFVTGLTRKVSNGVRKCLNFSQKFTTSCTDCSLFPPSTAQQLILKLKSYNYQLFRHQNIIYAVKCCKMNIFFFISV